MGEAVMNMAEVTRLLLLNVEHDHVARTALKECEMPVNQVGLNNFASRVGDQALINAHSRVAGLDKTCCLGARADEPVFNGELAHRLALELSAGKTHETGVALKCRENIGSLEFPHIACEENRAHGLSAGNGVGCRSACQSTKR